MRLCPRIIEKCTKGKDGEKYQDSRIRNKKQEGLNN
jgi:hypothetical protein